MARGNEAKAKIVKKIIECFGQENAFEYDKKLYVNTTEGGSPIQICLTMTCPKVAIGGVSTNTAAPAAETITNAFDAFGAVTEKAPEPFTPAEITPEERETVMDIMKRLGL